MVDFGLKEFISVTVCGKKENKPCPVLRPDAEPT